MVNVEDVFVCSSFLEVYSTFPKEYFGHSDMVMEEAVKNIYIIYSKEQERTMGVVAIKFKVEGSSY